VQKRNPLHAEKEPASLFCIEKKKRKEKEVTRVKEKRRKRDRSWMTIELFSVLFIKHIESFLQDYYGLPKQSSMCASR